MAGDRPKRADGIARRALRWGARLVVGLLVLSLLLVVPLRWVDPPTSAVMAQHWIAGWLGAGERPYVHQEWVDWEEIPPQLVLAAIAAEDQRFPQHRGFDLVQIRKALEARQGGNRLRGASTISQQTAKNLFLWPGRDYVRKGLEAWLTVLIELFWSKRRIMEIYLNIAQFGPDTYGVGAASWRYLERPVAALTGEDAALLAAVLPNPIRYRLDAPSAHVVQRVGWIRSQMRRLGGVQYLKGL